MFLNLNCTSKYQLERTHAYLFKEGYTVSDVSSLNRIVNGINCEQNHKTNCKISLTEFSRIVKRIVTQIITIFHSIFLFKVKADGNCIVQSILKQVSMKTEGVMNRYSSIYLRRQVINNGLNNIEILRTFLEKNIREIYGLGEGGIGPFSICSYFEHILKDKSWRDSIFVNLLASVWGVRITILRCDTLTEIRYRHESPLKEVCIGLLYNEKEEGGGHYSPLVRVDGEFLDSTTLFLSEEYYDEDVDNKEREFRGWGGIQGGTIF